MSPGVCVCAPLVFAMCRWSVGGGGVAALDLQPFTERTGRPSRSACAVKYTESQRPRVCGGSSTTLLLLMPASLLGDDDWLAPGFEAVLTEIFSRFDADGDGSLSVPELQAFVRACNGGEEMDEDELSQLSAFHVDAKGQMTRRGFFEMMHLQTMARPEDSWADLKALGYKGLTPMSGRPGGSTSSGEAGTPHDVQFNLDERLAMCLQHAEDAKLAEELAAELALEDERAGSAVAARVAAASGKGKQKNGKKKGPGTASISPLPRSSSTGNVREERLAAAAHKMVEHLGKSTAKLMASTFKTDGSLGALLQLMEQPATRVAVLELVDAGQRDRVDAECTALAIDLLPRPRME